MAAGSVRLPDLTQKITVDTKDLDKAVLAAKRFKSEMDKSLQVDSGNSGKGLDDLAQRLERMAEANEKVRTSNESLGKSFHDQQADIDGFASSLTAAEAELKKFSTTADEAFKVDTSKFQSDTDKVSEKMEKLRGDSEELRKSQEELSKGLHETAAEAEKTDDSLSKLEAENAQLRGEVTQTQGEVTRLEESLKQLSAEVARGGAAQDDFAKRTRNMATSVKGAANDVESAEAKVAAATAKYNDALSKQDSASLKATAAAEKRSAAQQNLTRRLDEQGKAQADLTAIENRGAASAEEIAAAADKVSKARQAAERATSAEATAQAKLTDAESKAFIVAGEREKIQARMDAANERAFAAAARGTAATEAGTRAVREQELAETNLARIQQDETVNMFSLAQATDRVSKARQDVARYAAQSAAAEASMTDASIKARQAEEELENTDANLAAAHERVRAAQENLNATRTAAVRTAEDLRRAEADLQGLETQSSASAEEVEAATRKVAAAREAATKASGNYARAEAGVTDADRNHTTAAREAEKATQDLAKAHTDLEAASKRASSGIKDAEKATRLLSSGAGAATSLVTGLVGAIRGMAIAGVIAGGIGVLGSGVIGLGAAVTSAVPAALALTGAIGGLGVTVLGLKAIFSDNKGLKPAVDELKKSFEGIQDDLQRRVNPSIIAFLKQVEQLAPMVRAAVPAFAEAFNQITNRLTNLLKDSGFQKDLQTIIASGIKQFQLFGNAGVTALRGIIGLAAETGPYVERLGVLANKVAAEFTDWVASARQTGEIRTLIDNATKSLEAMLRIVANLAVGFKNLFEASNISGFTDAVLGALTTITGSFRTFTRDRQADLQAMFRNLSTQVSALPPLFDAVANGIRTILTKIDLRPLIAGIIEILPNLASGLVEAANAAARLGQLAAPAINSILTLVRGLIPYVERIGAAFLTNVKPAIDAVTPGILRVGQLLANLAEKVMPVLGGAARTVGQDFSGLVSILAPIGDLVGVIVGALSGFSTLIGNIAVGFVALKVGQAIFSGLGQVIAGNVEPANRVQKAIASVANTAKVAATGVRVAALDMSQAYTDTSTKVEGAFRGLSESVNTATAGIRTGLANSRAAFEELGTNAEENGHKLTAAFANASASVVGGGERIVGAAGTVVGGMGKIAGAAAGAGAALKSGFTSAVTGVVGALGGPWGVAITAAVLALTAFQQSSQEAAQTQQQLRDALSQSGGVIDANVTKMVQAKSETEYLSVAAGKLGMSQTQVVEAFLKGGPALDDYINKITDGAGAATGFAGIGDRINASLGSQQAQARVAAGSLKELSDQTRAAQDAEKAQNEELSRSNLAMTTQQRNAQNVAQGFDKIRQSAGDSSKAVDGLSQALDGITGHGRDAEKASADLTESIDSLGQSIQDSDGKIQILNGTLNTTTKAGAEFSQASDEMRTKALASAQAAFQQAGGMSNVQAATAAATREVQRSRDALIESAVHFGATRQEAEKYADQLGLIPQTVVTAIEADPAKAQATYEQWKAGVPANPPPPAPVDANVAPAQKTLQDQLYGGILAPPGGPTQAPVGANVAPAQTTIQNDLLAGIVAPPGGPPNLPVGADTSQAQAQVDKQKGQIIAPQGGPPPLPVSAITQLADAIVADLVRSIQAPAGGAPKLPISADVRPGEAEALAWVARINAYPAAALPIHANLTAFNDELAKRIAEITKTPVAVPITANIDQLNAIYNQAFTFITGNVMIVPISGNIDQLNQIYHDAYVFITTNVIVAPVAGDFSQLINMYEQIVQILESTPIIIPIYGQFMGIVGGGGGGGGAGGGMMAAADGAVVDYFANGGLSARDQAAMKSVLGDSTSFNASGNMKPAALWSAMGLTPMAADKAQVVAPNTWRVIGDRPQGDEAFIPLNNSQRSESLLAEAANRMGFAVSKMAAGGFGNAATTTTGSPASDGSYTSTSTTNNQTDAPLINGDLNIVVPQDTPVQDAMDEALFQIRRIKRGGVYAANRTRG